MRDRTHAGAVLMRRTVVENRTEYVVILPHWESRRTTTEAPFGLQIQSIAPLLRRWCSKRIRRAPDLPAEDQIDRRRSGHRSLHAKRTDRVRSDVVRLRSRRRPPP